MKICRNCKKLIYDDALVCPYCGCVNRNEYNRNIDTSNNVENIQNRKGRLWLWIIGWIFLFPVPLSILITKSKKINKTAKIAFLMLIWIIFIAIGMKNNKSKSNSVNENAGNVRAFTTNEEEKSMGKSVTTEMSEESSSTGIEVEAINFVEMKSDISIGDSLQVKTDIVPENAEDRNITWISSNENVATIDESGNINAIGGGTCTIVARASNGIENSFDINVNANRRLMKVSTRYDRDDDNNIGHEWAYDIKINGDRAPQEMELSVGETISFSAKMVESDKKPDVGSESSSYTVTEDDIINGFKYSLEVYVTENGGRNSGKSAHFIVTYSFSPK